MTRLYFSGLFPLFFENGIVGRFSNRSVHDQRLFPPIGGKGRAAETAQNAIKQVGRHKKRRQACKNGERPEKTNKSPPPLEAAAPLLHRAWLRTDAQSTLDP